MIRKDTDYALRVLVDLGSGGVKPATAREVSARQEVPLSFAQKILRRLARAGILSVKAGRQGGFALAKAPGAITLMEVITVIQGRPLLSVCMKGPGHCHRQKSCPITGHLRGFQDKLEEYFEGATLADLLKRAAGKEPAKGRRRATRKR
jgi:Rrf2 family protein